MVFIELSITFSRATAVLLIWERCDQKKNLTNTRNLWFHVHYRRMRFVSLWRILNSKHKIRHSHILHRIHSPTYLHSHTHWRKTKLHANGIYSTTSACEINFTINCKKTVCVYICVAPCFCFLQSCCNR